MAVIFKKKAAVQPIAPPEGDQALLAEIGLLAPEPASVPEKKGIIIVKKPKSFSFGDRVSIKDCGYYWCKQYQGGDTGVVRRSWAAPQSPLARLPDDNIYEIELDVERVPGRKTVHVHFWQLATT